jgi:hypothetical protein
MVLTELSRDVTGCSQAAFRVGRGRDPGPTTIRKTRLNLLETVIRVEILEEGASGDISLDHGPGRG